MLAVGHRYAYVYICIHAYLYAYICMHIMYICIPRYIQLSAQLDIVDVQLRFIISWHPSFLAYKYICMLVTGVYTQCPVHSYVRMLSARLGIVDVYIIAFHYFIIESSKLDQVYILRSRGQAILIEAIHLKGRNVS
jgi:hypothetical protein